MRPLDIAAAAAVIVIWALNFIIGKIGVAQWPPVFMMLLRFALVAMLLAPFLRPHGKPWALIFGLSVVLGGLHFGLLFTGLRGVDAGPAALAIQLAIPFSSLIAAVVYGERMGRWQMIGMVIAFAGVYLIGGEPKMAPSLFHFLLVVGAALAWAVANIFIKRIGSVNVFILNAWVAVFALPQLALATAVLEDGHMDALANADWRGWGAVAFMAIGSSIIAYGFWYALVRKYDVNRVVPLTLIAPVLAVMLAVLILNEPLTVRIVVGGLITTGGVAMIQLTRPADKQTVAQP